MTASEASEDLCKEVSAKKEENPLVLINIYEKQKTFALTKMLVQQNFGDNRSAMAAMRQLQRNLSAESSKGPSQPRITSYVTAANQN